VSSSLGFGDAEGGLANSEPGRDADRFFQRAARYTEYDRELFSKTRFFAAAAATNFLLGNLSRVRILPLFPDNARRLLSQIGTSLESLNIELANRVKRESARGLHVDLGLVQAEQQALQHQLQNLGSCHPMLVRAALHQIDGLLNPALAHQLCRPLIAGVSQYVAVLQEVRTNLGMPIEFSLLTHRINIGMRLTHAFHQRLPESSLGLLSGRRP
jgi:hypothetical protein